MQLLASWLSLSLTLWVTSLLVPGFRVNGIRGALIVGALFGLLHFAIGWFLFSVIVVSTLFIGLLFKFVISWIVSAIVLKMVDALSDNLSIDGFVSALIASAVMSAVSSVGSWLFR